MKQKLTKLAQESAAMPAENEPITAEKMKKRDSSQYLGPARIADSLLPTNKSFSAQKMELGMHSAPSIPRLLSVCGNSILRQGSKGP